MISCSSCFRMLSSNLQGTGSLLRVRAVEGYRPRRTPCGQTRKCWQDDAHHVAAGHRWRKSIYRLDLSDFLPVCTENLIRVDDVMESPKLVE